MPRLIDTDHRTQSILLGSNKILLEQGLGGLTLRAIAAEVRISLGSLTSHYKNRERLLHLLLQLAGQAWLESISERIWTDGALALLPTADDGVDDTRVWLSWCELGRSTPGLRGTVQNIRLDERQLLDRATKRGLAGDALDIALAVVHGLREAVCAGDDPMPLDRARVLLSDHLDQAVAASAFARSSATIRSGSAAE